MAGFRVSLVVAVLILAHAEATPAAEIEPAPDGESPGPWCAPDLEYSAGVLCTDMMYPPPGEYPDEAQAITPFTEKPWFLRLVDWVRDLFTLEGP